MNLKGRMIKVCVAVLFACFSASTAFSLTLPITAFWAQHKLTSGKFPIHSACMMPPEGHLTKIGMKGAEGMTNESEVWAEDLEALVESQLRNDGIAITSAANPLSSGASNDEIRSAISQVQQKYSSFSSLMRKKPGGIAKSAYTLGDQVETLPCAANSEILVFVQGVGQVLSQGRGAMSALVGGPDEDGVLFVTFADAKTGEIIGFIQVYPNDASLLEAETAFGQKLGCQLSNMNIGSARKNSKGCEQ
jgi:hypothetical protein